MSQNINALHGANVSPQQEQRILFKIPGGANHKQYRLQSKQDMTGGASTQQSCTSGHLTGHQKVKDKKLSASKFNLSSNTIIQDKLKEIKKEKTEKGRSYCFCVLV